MKSIKSLYFSALLFSLAQPDNLRSPERINASLKMIVVNLEDINKIVTQDIDAKIAALKALIKQQEQEAQEQKNKINQVEETITSITKKKGK